MARFGMTQFLQNAARPEESLTQADSVTCTTSTNELFDSYWWPNNSVGLPPSGVHQSASWAMPFAIEENWLVSTMDSVDRYIFDPQPRCPICTHSL